MTRTQTRLHSLLHAFFACCLLTGAVSLYAKPANRDLGDGLLYFRAEIIPRDLPPADVKAGPLILDLRYALAEVDASTALNAWLKLRATAKTPVFLLLNSDTAPGLKTLLREGPSRPSVITIGRANQETKPDIEVETTDDEERRAYEALEQNTPIESLLVENLDKPRIDEASIMRARDEAGEDLFQADPLDRILPTETKEEAKTPPPIDRALLRAVHLHRALRALKRL